MAMISIMLGTKVETGVSATLLSHLPFCACSPLRPGMTSVLDFTQPVSSDGKGPHKLSVMDYAKQGWEDRGCCDFVHSVGWTKQDHPMARCVSLSEASLGYQEHKRVVDSQQL